MKIPKQYATVMKGSVLEVLNPNYVEGGAEPMNITVVIEKDLTVWMESVVEATLVHTAN